MVAPNNAFDRLYRAMRQVDPLNEDGLWQLVTSGTINIIGGGAGGTSMTDNNPFTPGGTSIVPMGGYVGGRQIASGNAGAVAISPSGLLLVDVRAGGAGGGQANLTVRGTANTDLAVGYASGAGPNVAGGAYVPILGTVNLGAGAAPFASVAVYGSPANPVYVVGSVNIVNAPAGGFASAAVYGSPANPVYVVGSVNVVNAVGVTAPAGSLHVFGTVNIRLATTDFTVWMANGAGGFASAAVYGSPANPVYAVGSVNVVNNVGVFGSVSVQGTVTLAAGAAPFASVAVYGSPANPVYVIGSVNVVNGGAGFASAAVYGSPANPVYNIGSVNVVNPVGIFGSVSMQGTVTLAAGAAPFASVAVYGSPANPVYIVGSAFITNGSLPMIALGGSVGALGIGGSMGVTQIGSPWGVIGSVGVTPLASFTVNLGNIPTVNLGLGTVNVGNAHGIFGSVSVLGSVNLGAGGIVGVFGSVSVLGSVNLGAGGIVGIFGSVSVLGSVNIGGIPIVDTRGSLVGTIWPIAHAGSGYFAIANASLSTSPRVYLYAIHVSADNSAVVSFQSPSGTFLSGSIRIPGAAGFNMGPGQLGNPLIIGATNATLFLQSAGSGNIGGFAAGWIGV